MKDVSDPHEFTRLLKNAQRGDSAAEQQFCRLVNDELRREAGRLVRAGREAVAQPTSLVNELFLRLFREAAADDLKNRRYFFTVAIDQMRQILRERIRRSRSQKRGGHLQKLPLDIVLDQYLDDFKDRSRFDFEALDQALERLKTGKATRRQYEVVTLRYLAGLTVEETAELLGISPRTVAYDWKLARAKLYVEIGGNQV